MNGDTPGQRRHAGPSRAADGKTRDLRARTKAFALQAIHLYSSLPKTTPAQVIGRQMLRSGTSVGAHCREACRARSTAEFVSKIEGALQELEETGYWLELLADADIVPSARVAPVRAEVEELTAILVTSALTAKGKRRAQARGHRGAS
jgi:four helix bundle protein